MTTSTAAKSPNSCIFKSWLIVKQACTQASKSKRPRCWKTQADHRATPPAAASFAAEILLKAQLQSGVEANRAIKMQLHSSTQQAVDLHSIQYAAQELLCILLTCAAPCPIMQSTCPPKPALTQQLLRCRGQTCIQTEQQSCSMPRVSPL